MNHKVQTSGGNSDAAFWLFLPWFFACLGIYLWNIPPRPLETLHLLTLSLLNSNVRLDLLLTTWTHHLVWLLGSFAALLAILGTGERGLCFLGKFSLNPWERWAWELAIGFLFWGLLAEGLALEKILFPHLLQEICLACLFLILGRDRLSGIARCSPFSGLSTLPWFWRGAWGAVILLSLCNLLAPEMSWDAMTYQLILPKFYLMKHGFFKVDGIVPSHYPALGQMFFSWGLAWGDDSLARTLCFFAHWGTAIALVGLGSRFENPRAGWIAAAFYFVFPYLNIFSTRGYADLFLGFYFVLGIGTLITALFGNREAAGKEKSGDPDSLFALAMVAGGVLWGLKYNAAAFWLSGFVLGVAAWSQNHLPRAGWAWLLLPPAFFFAPWALKSWVYVHDPLFPFLPDVFHSFDWSDFDEKASKIKFHVEGFPGMLALPKVLWGIFFNRYSGAPNEEVSLIPLLMTPFFFVRNGMQPWKWAVGVAALLPFSLWLVTSHQLRLISGVIGLVCLLSGIAYERFHRYLPVMGRTLHLIFGLYLWLLAWYLFQGLVQQPNPFLQFIGLQSREEFLSGLLRPAGYLGVARELNQKLPLEAKVLCLGQQNGYYLDRVSAFDFDYTEPELRKLTVGMDSPEGIFKRFKEAGYTHILYNANAMMGTEVREDVLGVDRFPWKVLELRNYEQFFLKYTRQVPLAATDNYALYEVGPRDGFSPLPNYLPGTEAYYLKSMAQSLGLKKTSDIVGQSIAPETYLKSYWDVAEKHPELGYPCFQWAFAKLSNDPQGIREARAKGEEGFKRNGDRASWLVLQGDELLAEMKPSKAIPLFEEAKTLSPDREDVARNLTSSYYNIHDFKRASREAERASELAPYSEDYRQLAKQLRDLASQ